MEKDYKLYDATVAKTMDIIFRSSSDETIKIYRFNPEDESHLFYFKIAEMASQISKKKLCVNMPFMTWLKNKQYRKYRYIWTPYYHSNITWNLDLVARELNLNPIIFGEIYNEYYKAKEESNA